MDINRIEVRTYALLVNIYQDLQASGVMPDDKLKYFNGFIEAALIMGAYSPEKLDELVDDANLEVFGMTLLERKNSSDYRSFPELFDQPAYQRKMKVSDALKSKCAE